MPAQADAPPPFLSGSLLGTPHAAFSRRGGVSEGPFASLNLSHHVGDAPDNVRENRRRALAVLAAQGLSRLVSLGQVHGDDILVLREMPEREEYPGFDAAITNVPGLALLIRQADCQAVLLHDPERRVVAATHCGWRGSVAGIIGKTIARMREEFAVNPQNLRALITPSLGPCCAEFVNYKAELPVWMHSFQTGNSAHFDFWAISRQQLTDAGVPPEHIETTGICTRCDRNYFSYRRAKQKSGGICGRQGSVVGLAG